MVRVITYGTFDLLHYGHIHLLRRAKALGDYLIVALSTDEFNVNKKHKKSYFSYEERKLILESIRYVDLIIPEESWEQKPHDITKYEADIFVIGDDWTGKFDFLKTAGKGCQVVYLPRTPEISTTHIKNDLGSSETTTDSKLTLLLQQQKELLDLESKLLERLSDRQTDSGGGCFKNLNHAQSIVVLLVVWSIAVRQTKQSSKIRRKYKPGLAA